MFFSWNLRFLEYNKSKVNLKFYNFVILISNPVGTGTRVDNLTMYLFSSSRPPFTLNFVLYVCVCSKILNIFWRCLCKNIICVRAKDKYQLADCVFYLQTEASAKVCMRALSNVYLWSTITNNWTYRESPSMHTIQYMMKQRWYMVSWSQKGQMRLLLYLLQQFHTKRQWNSVHPCSGKDILICTKWLPTQKRCKQFLKLLAVQTMPEECTAIIHRFISKTWICPMLQKLNKIWLYFV